mmetsp:Transcript_71052/g.123228  ORF Transcript_71052/g.123228 Transcript_71052/m.123228 type:complete len:556 (-) Transcript_71052:73-1740(-)
MPASAGEAAVLLSVAKTELKQGSEEAVTAAKKALQAFKDVKDKDGIAEATGVCISASVLVGDLSEASKMATDLVKSSSTGPAKLSLAEVLLAQAKLSDALKAAEEAKAAFDAAGDKKGSVDASLAVSKGKLMMGDKSEALEAAQGAAELANSLGEEDSEASAWLGIMAARFAFGATEDAVSAAYAAMGIYGEVGDELGEAVVLMKLAEAMKAGMPGEALSVASQAQEKFADLGCKAAAAASLDMVVSCMLTVGQSEEAVAVAKKGAASMRGSGAPEAVALMALMTAEVASKSAEAMEVGKDVLALCKSVKMEKQEAQANHLLCKVACTASEWESAKTYGDAALTLFKGLGDTASESAVAKTLEAVTAGLEQAPAVKLEKEMKARAQREMELELVKEAAQAVEADDMRAFGNLYAKMAKMEFVTAEECAAILEPVMESNAVWVVTEQAMRAAATAAGREGYTFEVFHKRVSYMMHRLGGMNYGPNLRCVGDAIRHIPEADVAVGRLSLYEGFHGAGEDWEGIAGYHANILDASLQVQSGFGIPSAWQKGIPDGITV